MGTLTTTLKNYFNSASGQQDDAESFYDSKASATAWCTSSISAFNATSSYGSASSSSSTNYLGYNWTKTSNYWVDTVYDDDGSGDIYCWTGEYTVSISARRNLLKVSFSRPTDIDATSLGTATLKFTIPGSDYLVSGHANFYVCAPATSSSTLTGYKVSSDSVYYSTKKKVTGYSTGNATYSIDITTQFRQALSTGQLWIALVMKEDNYKGSNYIRLGNGATIEYTIGYTKCIAPTTIKWKEGTSGTATSTSGICTGGSTAIKIDWSGAGGGTNNAINGYTIYYREGAAPTTSTYTGTLSAASNASTVTITAATINGLNRGSKYYIGIVAKGAAGTSWNSAMSTASCYFQINKLPSAPSVTRSTAAVVASGATSNNITFTNISAGTDTDGQTYTVYYSLGSGTKTLLSGNSISFTKSTAGSYTYNFYTYDTKEYSSAKSYTITVAAPPTITTTAANLMTMKGSALTPMVTVSNRSFVKDIIGTATTTQGDGVTLSYNWYLIYATTAAGTPSTQSSSIGSGTVSNNSISLNYDVTNTFTGFDRSYKLKLVVTDSVGQSAELTSSNIFYLSALPTVTFYNKNSTGNVTNSIATHIDTNFRVEMSGNNTSSVTRKLKYATTSSGVLNGTDFATLTSLTSNHSLTSSFTRGSTYYFGVVFTLGNLNQVSSVKTYTRAKNMTPNSITCTKQNSSSTAINPYTDEFFSFTFDNQGINYTYSNDYNANTNSTYTGAAIHKIYLITSQYPNGYDITSYVIGANDSTAQKFSINDGIVTARISLTKLLPTTSSQNIGYNWNTILGKYPNGQEKVIFKVVTYNIFGVTFSNQVEITLDFTVGFETIDGTTGIDLLVKATKKNNTDSSTETVYVSGINKFFNNYTLRFHIVLATDVSQTCTVNITSNDKTYFTAQSNKTLNINTAIQKPNKTYSIYYGVLNVDVNLPSTIYNDVTSVNYTVSYTLANGKTGSITLSGYTYYRNNPGAITTSINSITKTVSSNKENYTINYSYTDFGGSDLNETAVQKYKHYSRILMYIYHKIATAPSGVNPSATTYLIDSNGEIWEYVMYKTIYNPTASSPINPPSSSMVISVDPYNEEIVDFKIRARVYSDYYTITEGDYTTTATGTNYTYQSIDTAARGTFYSLVPTVTYGKNHLGINTNAPERSGNILELYSTDARKKIYIGKNIEDGFAMITVNDEGQVIKIELDNFYIDGGTW